MEILGLTFVGTVTSARAEHTAFLRDVLGLTATSLDGVDADVFHLPDGSALAVTTGETGTEGRTVGLLVRDLDAAVRELHEAGVATDSPAVAGPWRYAHFHAPDGRLYELVERIEP